MPSLVGQSIDQYYITEEIGSGGMATIFRATQTKLGREVAIKVLPQTQHEMSEEMRDRFYREVQVIASLQHPHILPVYDFGEYGQQPYIVMAYMSGGSLADLIIRHDGMRFEDTRRLLRQIAEALDYAHSRGVIHRDIKPPNILLDLQGNTYLADFGLARQKGGRQITAGRIMIGTPEYMAPEWAGTEEITYSADIYSLGATLYHMLTGHVPYPQSHPMQAIMAHRTEPIPDPRALRPDLPAHVTKVIQRALAKHPTDRYESAQTLVDDLDGPIPRTASSTGMRLSLDEGTYFYPNTWARSLLLAGEEVLGKEAIDTVLANAGLMYLTNNYPPDNMKREFSIEHIGTFSAAVLRYAGTDAAIATGHLAGRYVLKYGLQQTSGFARIAKMMITEAAPADRLRVGLESHAQLFNDLSDAVIEVEQTDRAFLWHVARCPTCWGVSAEEEMGYIMIGMIYAGLEWAESGTDRRVYEVECIAHGDRLCKFVIEK